MSRHRDIRRMDYSEEYGAEEVYGRSLEEEYAVSPTSAQFIFNRENSQGASLMSYISSKEPIPMSPLNVSTKGDTSVMNFDIKVDNIPDVSTKDVQLESGIQYIRSIISDQFGEDDMIEAMKHCNMDAEAALNHLLQKGSSSHQSKMNKQRDSDNSSNNYLSHTVFNAHHDTDSKLSNSTNKELDASQMSLSSLETMHMHTIHSDQGQDDKAAVEQHMLPELSLSDLANIHIASLSSPACSNPDNVVKGRTQQVGRTSLGTDGLSLTDLANLHVGHLVTQEGMSVPSPLSNNLSQSELASTHMSNNSTDYGCSSYDAAIEVNPQLASLDFITGFTVPKTGSTLSLSQLASLGSTPTSSKSAYKHLNNTGGLAALAAAHLNCLENDNMRNPVDLSSVKPPPGLVPSTKVNVVKSSEDTPLASAVNKLTIEEPCVNLAGASAFADVICMGDRDKPKRLVKRHGHLKRKCWRALINPHKKCFPFFTFTTPSPDDYVIQKQRQVFNSS